MAEALESEKLSDTTTSKNVAAKAGVEVQDQDIDRSHRLGAPKPGRPRQIIVKFTRYISKDPNL